MNGDTADLGCDATRELMAELAAGVGPAEDRAAALRHIAGCADCHRELESISFVADELLSLAPEQEPPSGFEDRVLARLGPRAPRRLLWRRTRVAVALVAAIAVGAVTVWQVTSDDRRLAASYRRTLQTLNGRYMTARTIAAPDGSMAGRVVAYQGTPSWIFITLAYGAGAGPYEVRITTRDGREERLGVLDVQNGSGSWGTTIDMPVAGIAEVRLSGTGLPYLSAGFGARRPA
ncbi:hypothetical protein J5X84_42825 [Streptosporangiaceae bacterium NEAU-GS5]|nr:hypothetical protein [Streptosporangiaceae bacterium NEAU-GS5]